MLQRYIAANLVRGWLLATLVMAALFGLLGFIAELDRTARDYNAIAAARYILFSLPQQLISLAPVVALLGSIFALANLDRHNELTIISGAGVPPRKLVATVLLPTLGLMLLLWGSMEYLGAPLHRNAEQQRLALRHNNNVPLPPGGVWARRGNHYMHLNQMLEGGMPGDITLYRIDEQGQLDLALRAQTAQVGSDRRWLFEDVRVKEPSAEGLDTRRVATLAIPNLWAPEELPSLALSSQSMSLTELRRHSRDQTAGQYLHAFWQKLATPFTVMAMVLLATPISANLGTRRARNLGVNMAIGALVGILFYLGTQIVFALGQLLGANVVAVVFTPAAVVLLCALALLRRMRW